MAEILGLEYEGIPSGPAMGAINGINEHDIRSKLNSVLDSPAGMASLGSIGSRFNAGNWGETYFHDQFSGETLNSMGLPEIGIDQALPLIGEYTRKFTDRGKILIVGITALRGEDAADVLPELASQVLEAGASVVEVNYSCPNIVVAGGGRKPILGYDPSAIEYVRGNIVQKVGDDVRIQEKLPPYTGEFSHLIPEIAKTYCSERRLGKIGITGFNTVPGVTLYRDNKPVLRIIAEVDGEELITHTGGLSGPAVANDFTIIQNELLAHLPPDVPFIAAGGIWSGGDVRARINDQRVQAATGVSRYFEAEKNGLSYGRAASRVAEEYAEAA